MRVHVSKYNLWGVSCHECSWCSQTYHYPFLGETCEYWSRPLCAPITKEGCHQAWLVAHDPQGGPSLRLPLGLGGMVSELQVLCHRLWMISIGVLKWMSCQLLDLWVGRSCSDCMNMLDTFDQSSEGEPIHPRMWYFPPKWSVWCRLTLDWSYRVKLSLNPDRLDPFQPCIAQIPEPRTLGDRGVTLNPMVPFQFHGCYVLHSQWQSTNRRAVSRNSQSGFALSSVCTWPASIGRIDSVTNNNNDIYLIQCWIRSFSAVRRQTVHRRQHPLT